jgi:uncharacterized protein
MNKKLNKKEIIKKIESQKEELKKKGVKKFGLFGSYAKGKENKKSDIDFLVEFKETNFEDYTNLLILLEKMFKRKIDLVIEKNLRPELNYVKKEAKYVRL